MRFEVGPSIYTVLLVSKSGVVETVASFESRKYAEDWAREHLDGTWRVEVTRLYTLPFGTE